VWCTIIYSSYKPTIMSSFSSSVSISSLIDAFNTFADAPQVNAALTPVMVSFRVPLLVCLGYLITIFGLQAILRVVNKGKPATSEESITGKGKSVSLLNRITAVHNFLLSIFSLWLCVGLTRHVITLFTNYGALALYCGAPDDHLPTPEGQAAFQINLDILWYASSFHSLNNSSVVSSNHPSMHNRYGNIFYLSKYWELFDTILLVLRGRPLTLLHVFHHIAALLICWYAVHDAMVCI
jgi:hypothetical protein